MTISKLLLDRLPADFHRRLENWGDVMRSRGTYGVSPTYDICRMLAKKAGKLPPGEDFDRDLDEVDAGFIEAAWRNSVYRMLHQHRELLRAHYVARVLEGHVPGPEHPVAGVRRHAGPSGWQFRRFRCTVRTCCA